MMLRKLLFLLLFVTYDFFLCFLLSLVAFERVELHHLPVSSALFTRSQVPNSNIFLLCQSDVCFIYFINYLLKHVVCFFLYVS